MTAKNAFSPDTCNSLSTDVRREGHVFLPAGGELEVNVRCGEGRQGEALQRRDIRGANRLAFGTGGE